MTEKSGTRPLGLSAPVLLAAARKRLPLVIIGGALILALIMIALRDRDVPPPRGERAWVVEVVSVAYDSLEPTLELFGSVRSPQDANLSAGIEATVEAVPVRDGATVAEGQLLVVLNEQDAILTLKQRQADVAEITAQLAFSERQNEINRLSFAQEKELLEISQSRFDRAKELFELGRLSRSDYENATENLKRQQLDLSRSELTTEESAVRLRERRAQLERAEAQVGQAQLDVERTRVTAPFSGVVSEVQVSEGDRVRVGDELMRLQNPDSVEVRTQIPANYAPTINAGLRDGVEMIATVDTETGSLVGYLTRLSGQIREGSGGVDGYIGFKQPPIGVRLGSTVRVVLQLPPERDLMAIPAEAIYGRDRLFKVVDDRMQSVQVQRLGERFKDDGSTEVIVRSAALQDRDQVIITKLSNASDGLLVRINRPEAATVRDTPTDITDGGQ
jgi:HlyD family secretion protein